MTYRAGKCVVETVAFDDHYPCRLWSWIAYEPDGVEIAARGLSTGSCDDAFAQARAAYDDLQSANTFAKALP